MKLRACFCAAAAALLFSAPPSGAEPLSLHIKRIDGFSIAGADLEGPLQFLGGLRLSSAHEEFGGLSGIEVSGSRALLAGDEGVLVSGELVRDEDGVLVDFVDAAIAPIFPEGDPRKTVTDVEDIAVNPGDPERGVLVRERQANAMFTFRLEGGRPTELKPMTVGADNRILRSNKGLESVAYAPPASPAAGQIIAIAERPPRGQSAIPGWIAGVGSFGIVPHDNFDVSSARFLPDGDLLLLERRFSPLGIALRLRRIAGEDLQVGALLDGDYLLDAGMTSPIDNMEGLSVHQDEHGRTVLTLVSDDNHSFLQQTILLQFALFDD